MGVAYRQEKHLVVKLELLSHDSLLFLRTAELRHTDMSRSRSCGHTLDQHHWEALWGHTLDQHHTGSSVGTHTGPTPHWVEAG